MINIIAESGIIDSHIRFKMLNGKCENLKEQEGTVFDIIGYMETEQGYEDDIRKILSIYTNDGRVFGTNSATVIRTFEAMVESFGEPTEENPIKGVGVYAKTSAKGRTFLDLDFAE